MSLEDHVAKLARNPILAALGPDALRLLAFSAETRTLRAGDVLFRFNEASNGGFVACNSPAVKQYLKFYGCSATRASHDAARSLRTTAKFH